MIGKQINFYTMPTDEEALLAHVLCDPHVALLGEKSPSKEVRIVVPPLSKDILVETQGFVLWNRRISSYPAVEKLQSGYFVDKFNSEVIEYSGSYLVSGTLRGGRLWIQTFREVDGQLLYKSQAFLKWFEDLRKWIRKNYSRDPHGWYVGPAAQKWAEAGGILQ